MKCLNFRWLELTMFKKFVAFCVVIFCSVCFSVDCLAREQMEILQGCVQKGDQVICPGVMDANFSENQLLYYSYQNKDRMKKAKEFYNKGVRHETNGKINFAKIYYIKAIEYMPDFVEAHNNLGAVYICLKRYDLALAEFQKVSEMSPDYFPQLYVNIGMAYEGKKDYPRALECYELAINLDQKNVLAHNNLASLYLKMNKRELAIKHLKFVNKISPGFLSEDVVNIIANN